MTVNVAGRAATLPHVLGDHANATPSQIALKFLADGERCSIVLSYAELVARAATIGAELERRAARGRAVVLLYPAGPDYLCALLGCFWAGAIAVPAYPPATQRLSRAGERVTALIADAGAELALTNAALAQPLRAAPEFERLQCLATDTWFPPLGIKRSAWQPPLLDPSEPCLLQYTSGSTSAPKGVVISHAQLLANLEILTAAGGMQLDGTFATWLPPYHDMGLIGALLAPLQRGNTIVQMPPDAFVRRPVRWLRALSEHAAVATATPNFALELCVRRVPEAQRAGLDLSALRVLGNGSEPIDPASLDAFVEAYAPYGLAREALAPCYGMAEATLVLSANLERRAPTVRSFDAVALEHGVAAPERSGARSRRLVGCGPAQPKDALRIVDARRRVELEPGTIGEIWASSPSIASGYWRRPEQTEQTFQARLAESGAGPFLRTGDLGFILDGELFVTGRIKDQINIRGKKHFPADVERTVQRLAPALIADAGAVFSIELGRRERLCVVQEVDHRLHPDLPALLDEVRRAVFEEHAVAVHAVVLVKRGSVSKTSSGKVRRSAVKAAFCAGELCGVAHWEAGVEGEAAPATDPRDTPERRARTIEQFIIEWVARRAELPKQAIDLDAPLARYAVDSLAASELAEELQAWLGTTVPSTISYEHPSTRAIAAALSGWLSPSRPPQPRTAGGDAAAARGGAIVGMACRFPAAPDLPAFWRLLRRGEDAVRELPSARWDPRARFDANARPGKLTSRFGGFVDAIDQFDAEFFGIAAHEAARMDPQQRMFLEVAWEALEDAGIPPASLAGSETGVFAAVCGSDHALAHAGDLNRIDADFATGNCAGIVPNRLSYFLDLKGPSQAFDSACASALAALHAALQSLQSGECELAIVGGVNAVLAPHAGVFLSNARALAGDGRCKTFDRQADGFVRSEGCGVIVLQSQALAARQRRRVYALVSGSAVAHGGRSNGLMAPNGPAQERVIRRALERARLSPDALDYVEAHGVGAKLADTVELRALGNVLRSPTRATPCWVGSVKTNLGHLEAASGIASLIKTALALHHEEIPPHLHLSDPQPELASERTPLAVPKQALPWRRSRRPRHAGVSAFGFGGTHAHAVLSEAPPARPSRDGGAQERPRQLLTLSARTPRALAELARRWADALPDLALPDACHSANAGREHFRMRAAFVAEDASGMSAQLLRFAAALAPPLHGPSQLALLFTESVESPAAGALCALEPAFRAAYAQAAAWIELPLGAALPLPLEQTAHGYALNEPLASARAVAFQYALFQLFASWGIAPSAVYGRGHTEYLAAAAAGVLTWRDGVRLAVLHRQLLASLVPGPELRCTLRQFKVRLAATPLCAARLPLLLATRGRLLDAGALVEPDALLASLQPSASAPPARNALRSLPANLHVEMGGREVPLGSEGRRAADAPLCIAGAAGDYASLLELVGQLYVRGIDIDWEAFDRPFPRRKLSLPSYPFQRQRCWLDPPRLAAPLEAAPAPPRGAHPLLRRMTREAPDRGAQPGAQKGTG